MIRPGRQPIAIALAALAVAIGVAGCGSGEPSGPTTTLNVTRDFGAVAVEPTTLVAATPGLTVMRQLEQTAEVETTYGGRFVNSINGLKGGGGNDWLFFVDGVESDKAATEWRLSGGEVVQWDFHAWQGVKTGDAIVGAFPRPLESAGAKLECLPAESDGCTAAKTALGAASVETNSAAADAVKVYVGEWSQLKGKPGVPDLTAPAADNGAFASVSGDGKSIVVINDQGLPAQRLEAGAGLIAASRVGTKVTWIVTGVDQSGVKGAAEALTVDALKNKFAVAIDPDGRIALPVASGPTASTGQTGATNTP